MTKGKSGKNPDSKFVRVKCNDCDNEQVIFDHASTVVKCLVCDKILATPKGGKAEIRTSIIETHD